MRRTVTATILLIPTLAAAEPDPGPMVEAAGHVLILAKQCGLTDRAKPAVRDELVVTLGNDPALLLIERLSATADRAEPAELSVDTRAACAKLYDDELGRFRTEAARLRTALKTKTPPTP